MINISMVVTERLSGKVIAYLPLMFENDTNILSPFHLEHKDYILGIYDATHPLFFRGDDGDIYLKQNCFIIHSNELDY